jgi:hypothetical protein
MAHSSAPFGSVTTRDRCAVLGGLAAFRARQYDDILTRSLSDFEPTWIRDIVEPQLVGIAIPLDEEPTLGRANKTPWQDVAPSVVMLDDVGNFSAILKG